tara:strand:+ start:66 stop:278 length:213 start_codon:yes stop_codon:yes gene_type:complete
MELTIITHTIVALSAMYATYLWGVKSTSAQLSEAIIGALLKGLEEEGLIKTIEDADGDTEILKPLTWETK